MLKFQNRITVFFSFFFLVSNHEALEMGKYLKYQKFELDTRTIILKCVDSAFEFLLKIGHRRLKSKNCQHSIYKHFLPYFLADLALPGTKYNLIVGN